MGEEAAALEQQADLVQMPSHRLESIGEEPR